MTRNRRSSRWIAVAAALSLTFLLPGGAAIAGIKQPDLTTTVQVVATGLNVPRGLVYDPESQRLLIAEAGVAAGDTGPCATGAGDIAVCYGGTGSVYSFALNGGRSYRVITGLPSTSDTGQHFVKGLEDLSLFRGKLSGVFGLSGTPATRTGLGPGAAALGQAVVFGRFGSIIPIADVATKETQLYNADMVSDPYGIATGKFGTLIANPSGAPVPDSDYGGNDVLQLKNGNLTQLVAFPARAPAADPSGQIESQPTTVTQGPGGAFYVGELTSYPYYPGEARVWRVVPGQAPTVFASGFSKIIDIAFDSRGRLLVLESGGRLSPAQLIRVDRDGTQTVLASTGLTDPGGLAVVNDHTFYVTNNSGGTGGDGQLLKISVSAAG